MFQCFNRPRSLLEKIRGAFLLLPGVIPTEHYSSPGPRQDLAGFPRLVFFHRVTDTGGVRECLEFTETCTESRYGEGATSGEQGLFGGQGSFGSDMWGGGQSIFVNFSQKLNGSKQNLGGGQALLSNE